jgi:hypothetical protein
MKSPLTKSLRKQLNNHRTPMKIKYCEINTYIKKATRAVANWRSITYMTNNN